MFDQAIILSLDTNERLKMSAELLHECEKRGFPAKRFIVGSGENKFVNYDHIDKPSLPSSWKFGTGISAQRHYWAYVSHREIIKYAIRQHYDSICLLEDDAVFTSRFDSAYGQILDNPLQFDILYLGSHYGEYHNHKYAGQNLIIEDEYKRTGLVNLVTIPQCGGLFGCVIRKSIFPLILNMPAVAPIDSQLNQYRNFIRSYNVVPNIIYPRSCWSSCENTFIERDVL